MKQEILTKFPWPLLPTVGLLIFFFFFVGLIIYVFRNQFLKTSVIVERLPLSDGDLYE